jgi:hypothetical protein
MIPIRMTGKIKKMNQISHGKHALCLDKTEFSGTKESVWQFLA